MKIVRIHIIKIYTYLKKNILALDFFQKIVIGLLLVNLVFVNEAIEAANYAENEASEAKSSAESAYEYAERAASNCEDISNRPR
jgi:hypothetical protein